jgi:leucyl-tRNA synthetase
MPASPAGGLNAKSPLKQQFIDSNVEQRWMPVSMYIGGPEHATMHLIYARFVMMALKDFGFVSNSEPFKRLVHQGLITNKGAKMSKSKGNVVSPDSFIERHGSDVFRMYLMFMGPFTDGGDWSDTGIKGIDRFVQRVWNTLTKEPRKGSDDPEVTAALHRSIKKVTDYFETLHFNTAISTLMEFLNVAEKYGALSVETSKTFVKLLAPLAPHLSDELWEALGQKDFVMKQSWPSYDPALLVTDSMVIAVQVNGKVRGEIEVASDTSEKDILSAAKKHANVAKYLEGKTPKKELYVKGKLVSFVL